MRVSILEAVGKTWCEHPRDSGKDMGVSILEAAGKT